MTTVVRTERRPLMTRTLALPSGVDAGSVQAEYRDGILEICVRMPEQRTEAVHVPVTRRSASA